MKHLVFVTVLSMVCAAPAYAESSYQTPEYSGPSAKLDRGFDTYHDNRNTRMNRALVDRDIQRMRANDHAFDAETQRRWHNTQNEMDRRRDEVIRGNQQYILEQHKIRTND